MATLTKLQDQVQADRTRELEERNASELERITALKETWNRHEATVKGAIQGIAQRKIIEYVDKVPFKGNPDNTLKICDKPKPLDTVPAKTVTVVQHAAEFRGGYYGMDFLFEPKPAYTPPFNRHRRSKYQRHSCG